VPDAIDNSWGDAERVAALARAITAEDAQLFYQIAINGRRDMGFAPDPRSGFEMLLLRMLAFRPAAVIDESIDVAQLQPVPSASAKDSNSAAAEVGDPAKKPRELTREAAPSAPPVSPVQAPAEGERAISGGVAAIAQNTASQATAVAVAATAEASPVPVNRPRADRLPAGVALQPAAENWPQLLAQLDLRGMVQNVAANMELVSVAADQLEFVLDSDNASLFNPGQRDKIALALTHYLGRDVAVSITIGQPAGETPAMRQARAARERQQQAVVEIENDPRLQALITRFDGELDIHSIAPLD
jgi:DNA polymerase-3 subunit gamma/tau